MRVIAGRAGGRRLTVPPGRGTRPTGDRVREALFSSFGEAVHGARVLDLFAGSGALGIEACSRGAAAATFVERDRRALAALRANLERTGLAGKATVVAGDVAAFCRQPRGGPYDLVLCDPPYELALQKVHRLLTDLCRGGGLAAAATVVVERDRRDPDLDDRPAPPLVRDHVRTYGQTVLLFERAEDS